MSIPIRFLQNPPLYPADAPHFAGTVDFSKLAVGDMCYYYKDGQPCTDLEYIKLKLHLTAHYFAHNAGRPPLLLVLPDKPTGKIYFMVDGQCYSSKCKRCGKSVYKNGCRPAAECVPRGYYDGWTVSGFPSITVTPSVNYDDDEAGVKHYHGFIQNGSIGDG